VKHSSQTIALLNGQYTTESRLSHHPFFPMSFLQKFHKDVKYKLLILPPSEKGRCEKIGLVLFHVIPAKAGIQCFHEVTNTLDPGFHRGDEYSVISSQLQGGLGGLQS
jgi:hypothetical protein